MPFGHGLIICVTHHKKKRASAALVSLVEDSVIFSRKKSCVQKLCGSIYGGFAFEN